MEIVALTIRNGNFRRRSTRKEVIGNIKYRSRVFDAILATKTTTITEKNLNIRTFRTNPLRKVHASKNS